ncbi:ubiquinol oxidase subunit II [Litchfieldella xinjiangensis]|uniref:ubiquinol oxidase subunit II n=1 Tax=Litchfieldella xinjiangensis TaxID=1166948 RepID=UPI0005B8F671|nr:ubiquinol oxidase subunit II [Halomonas xinjiangensis]
MRGNRRLRVLGVLLLTALPLLLAGCSSALLDPKGEVGMEQRTLILTAFGLMQIVVIPVIVMTLLFAWRYRRSNHKAAYNPDWAHNNWIEAIVWLIPCVIIVFLAGLTWYTSHSLDPHRSLAEDGEELEIQAVSLDWKWLFIYPEQGIATVNEVAFPANVPVRFRVSSGSVMNAFFIPHLGSQIYAMAGMDNDVHLIANHEGTYEGRSTNYSGAGFSEMTFEAMATSPEEFDSWVEGVRESSQTLTFPDGYAELVEPTINHPVEYFSSVSSGLYEDIVSSFLGGSEGIHVPPSDGGHGHTDHRAGEESHEDHGEISPTSAEAAE